MMLNPTVLLTTAVVSTLIYLKPEGIGTIEFVTLDVIANGFTPTVELFKDG